MKATPEMQRELLALQEIDNEAARLARAAAHLPQEAELAAMEPLLAQARRDHIDRTGALEDARTRLARAESDVAVVEARAARDEERMQHSSSVKDVAGLEAELASLAHRRSDLEDVQLAVMEEIESLEAALTEAEAELSRLDAASAELEEARARESAEIEVRRGKLEADRATVCARIDADLLALYEKQRARYGIGAALLRRGVSLGSNTTLNPADMAEIRSAAPDDVILCPESSCILVRTEDSGL